MSSNNSATEQKYLIASAAGAILFTGRHRKSHRPMIYVHQQLPEAPVRLWEKDTKNLFPTNPLCRLIRLGLM